MLLQAFREAWRDVAHEQAERDPDFARIYESYRSFREEYAKWREVGYLKE